MSAKYYVIGYLSELDGGRHFRLADDGYSDSDNYPFEPMNSIFLSEAAAQKRIDEDATLFGAEVLEMEVEE